MTTNDTSIFAKIINRDIPAHIIYEDEICIAILDIAPAVPGQSLVIPKVQVDYAFDLDPEIYQHIFCIAQKIALASDKALAAARTCLVVEGLDVPHVHIKLYPLPTTNTPLAAVMHQQQPAPAEALASTAALIVKQLASVTP